MAPVHHPVSALVYSALGHEVSTVIIDGVVVMRAGRITTVDERCRHGALAPLPPTA